MTLALFLLSAALSLTANAQSKYKIEVVPLIAHSDRVNSVQFSSDGRQVISGSSDKTVKLWDSATRLVEAAEQVCDVGNGRPELVVLRGSLQGPPAKLPHQFVKGDRGGGNCLEVMVPRDGIEPPTP